MVVVIDGNQVTKLQVACHGRRLASNTLHSAAIAEEDICMVGDQVEAGLVEDGGRVCLGNGETDSIGEALTKRASGHLDTGCVMGLRMTRSDAVNLAEGLQIVHADAVTEQVKKRILEHAAVAVAEIALSARLFLTIKS